jgi:hypothetical protein
LSWPGANIIRIDEIQNSTFKRVKNLKNGKLLEIKKLKTPKNGKKRHRKRMTYLYQKLQNFIV